MVLPTMGWAVTPTGPTTKLPTSYITTFTRTVPPKKQLSKPSNHGARSAIEVDVSSVVPSAFGISSILTLGEGNLDQTPVGKLMDFAWKN